MSDNEQTFDYAGAFASGNFASEEDAAAIESEANQATQQEEQTAPQSAFNQALARIRGALPDNPIGAIHDMQREAALGLMKAETVAEGPALTAGVAEGFQGMQQMGMEAFVAAGLMDEDMLKTFNEQTQADRDLVTQALEKEYGKGSIMAFMAEMQRGAGRAVPAAATLPLGSGAAGAAGTVAKVVPQGASVAASAGRVGLGALASAAGAASEFVEEGGSRAFNAAIGAFFGAGLNAAFEAPGFARNRVKRFLQGKIDEIAGSGHGLNNAAPDSPGSLVQKRLLDNAEEAKKIMDEVPGLELAPDQIMPSAQVGQAMALANKSTSIKDHLNFLYDSQPKAISAYVDGMILKLKGLGPRARFGDRVTQAFRGVIGARPGRGKGAGTGLLGKRASEASRDYEAAHVASGGRQVIPASNFVDELNDIISAKGRRTTPEFVEGLADKVKEVRNKLQPDGEAWRGEPITLAVKETQELLHTYGTAAEGTGRIWDDIKPKDAKLIANRLRNALKDDLNEAIDNGVAGAEELRFARDNFSVNSAKIKEVELSFVGGLLGSKNGKLSSEIEKSFLAADPQELTAAMNILQTADPELRKSLQSFWLEKHVKRAMRGGPAGAGEEVVRLVPGKLLEMVKGENADKLGAVFPGLESKEVDKLLKVTAAVINNNNRTGGMTATRLKDLAGVLASMDSTFLARIAADMLAPPLLAKWAMGGSRVASAMTTFTKPFDRQQGIAALEVLRDYLVEEWPETAAELESSDGN